MVADVHEKVVKAFAAEVRKTIEAADVVIEVSVLRFLTYWFHRI